MPTLDHRMIVRTVLFIATTTLTTSAVSDNSNAETLTATSAIVDSSPAASATNDNMSVASLASNSIPESSTPSNTSAPAPSDTTLAANTITDNVDAASPSINSVPAESSAASNPSAPAPSETTLAANTMAADTVVASPSINNVPAESSAVSNPSSVSAPIGTTLAANTTAADTVVASPSINNAPAESSAASNPSAPVPNETTLAANTTAADTVAASPSINSAPSESSTASNPTAPVPNETTLAANTTAADTVAASPSINSAPAESATASNTSANAPSETTTVANAIAENMAVASTSNNSVSAESRTASNTIATSPDNTSAAASTGTTLAANIPSIMVLAENSPVNQRSVARPTINATENNIFVEVDSAKNLSKGKIYDFNYIHEGDCPLLANEIFIGEGLNEATDLVNSWHEVEFGFRHYFLGFGSVTGSVNTDYRSGFSGVQYNVDAYPDLGGFGYMYVNYGYSPSDARFPRHRFGIEPFMSLPHSYEASLGYRYLDFVDSHISIYTGSIAKYVGNYYFALRAFHVPPSGNADGNAFSGSVTIRRYFLCADDYIALNVGGGSGKDPKNVEVNDEPVALSSFYISTYGKHPFNKHWYGNWSVGYYKEKYPNNHQRNQFTVGLGVAYRFD